MLGNLGENKMSWFDALLEFKRTSTAWYVRMRVRTSGPGKLSLLLCYVILMAVGGGVLSKTMVTGSDSSKSHEFERFVTIES